VSLLELEGVDAFYGASQALFDFDLAVERNEVVALLGRNGAGKTTTLRTITGTVGRREGHIEYDGEDISGLSVEAISNRGIKLVPEDRRIFPTLTVQENLMLARDACKGNEPRPIEDMYDVFPKLEELKQNLGQNLSGGEQQMLSVARALVQSPDLLLLDEPTEGLAPVIVDDLSEVLHEVVSEDVTVVITEQNVEFALELSQRAVIVQKGDNVWDGTVETLRENEELMDQYLSVGGGEEEDATDEATGDD
jgi:branched-chain amino acid transport system ATP-binding protein